MPTTEAEPITDEVKAAVAEWRKAYPNGVPVLHWPGGDRDCEPEIDFAFHPAALDEPKVTLHSTWKLVPMAHIEPHPLAAEVAALPKVEQRELDFPYPPCPFCGVDTFHNGDNFQCEHCHAIFDQHGMSERHCVEECDEHAEITGTDGQPRCITCEVRARAGEGSTPPYDCRRCKESVVGIPHRRRGSAEGARDRLLCPECFVGERNREWVDEILARRSS